MYCPLLCINPNNTVVAFGQCLRAACAWWVADGETGQCAICQLGSMSLITDKARQNV